MSPADVTIEILKSIRDEVKSVRDEVTSVRDEVRTTNTRLDATRTELGERIDVLSRRVVDSEVRTATAITDLHGTVREVVDVLREQHDLRPRVDRCERDIGDIKHRLGL
jgi:hypothetical protein